LAGGAPIDSAIARHLLLRFQSASEPAAGVPVPSLSARETEVLELVVKGLTFAEIARVLDVQTTTVKTYIRRIYRKLEVRSRSEAVFEALQLGIIDLDDSDRLR
jgi:DNA-binding NarL/FixJ family response regulator